MTRIFLFIVTSLLALTSMAQSEQLWGYNTDNTFKRTGYEFPSDYDVAVRVPATLAGRKIVAVNFPATTPYMKNLTLWGGTTTLGNKSLFKQDCSATKLPTYQYLRIELTEPVTVPADGMFIGYSFTIEEIQDEINDTHPIGVRSDMPLVPGSFYVSYAYYGGNWEDFSTQRVSALQLFLAVEESHANMVTLSSVTAQSVVKDTEGTLSVSLTNEGTSSVSSMEYDIVCDGTTTHGSHTFTPALTTGLSGNATLSLPFKAPSKAGHQSGSITITKVNGKANEASANHSASFSLDVLSRAAKRMTVVEEVTGTACAWCPSGWVIMDHIKREYADRMLGISIHWFNNYSPLYVADYDQTAIPTSMAPVCMVDRKTPLFDPYYGHDSKNAIAWAQQLGTALPEVSLNTEAAFTEGTASISASADVEFLTDVPDARIAFVLTADGVTSGKIRQTNAYADADPSQYPADLAIFCSGGKYGSNNVQIPYDDVMIGSSWLASNQAAAPTFSSCTAGSRETLTYTLSLPTNADLLKALQYNQLSVTVLVFKADGTIANASRCKVLGTPEGVNALSSLKDGMQSAIYTLDGRRIFNAQGTMPNAPRGLYLQQGKKLLNR